MTEKNYNPRQKERKAMKRQENVYKKTKLEEKKIIETEENKKLPEKDEEKKIEEQKISEEKKEEPEKKPAEKKETEKKEEKIKKTKEKPKRTESILDVKNLPISTKQAVAICRFIKGKKIADVISDLENVLKLKKPIPMKGEIAHRKGIMSGKYPKKASEHFMKLLKSLQANANVDGLENPVIVESIANLGSRPYGRFGRTRKKRTNVKIKVKEKINKQEAKNDT